MPQSFSVGDRICCIKATSAEYKNSIGTITAIIPAVSGSPEFTTYAIQFVFGKRTLYGTQIEPA